MEDNTAIRNSTLCPEGMISCIYLYFLYYDAQFGTGGKLQVNNQPLSINNNGKLQPSWIILQHDTACMFVCVHVCFP